MQDPTTHRNATATFAGNYIMGAAQSAVQIQKAVQIQAVVRSQAAVLPVLMDPPVTRAAHAVTRIQAVVLPVSTSLQATMAPTTLRFAQQRNQGLEIHVQCKALAASTAARHAVG